LGAPAVDGAPTKHVHLMIVQVMKPVWAAHGPSVKFEDLLYYAANLQRHQLPMWTYRLSKESGTCCAGATRVENVDLGRPASLFT
jgi:hypothetical protein